MTKKRKPSKAKPPAAARSADTEKKKTLVLGTAKARRKPLMLALGAVLLLAAGGALFIFGPWHESTVISTVGEQDSTATMVSHAVSQFDDGKAHHFSYTVQDGLKVRYFVLKSSDGIIRAAFDACDVCWPAGKGYLQEGDYMVCRNCGRRFASTLINEVRGGCNPAPLKRRIDGERLILQVADIVEGGKAYFDFRKRG